MPTLTTQSPPTHTPVRVYLNGTSTVTARTVFIDDAFVLQRDEIITLLRQVIDVKIEQAFCEQPTEPPSS